MQEPEYQEDRHLWLHRWSSLAVWTVSSGLMLLTMKRPSATIAFLMMVTAFIWFPAIIRWGAHTTPDGDRRTRKMAWCVLIGLSAFLLLIRLRV